MSKKLRIKKIKKEHEKSLKQEREKESRLIVEKWIAMAKKNKIN